MTKIYGCEKILAKLCFRLRTKPEILFLFSLSLVDSIILLLQYSTLPLQQIVGETIHMKRDLSPQKLKLKLLIPEYKKSSMSNLRQKLFRNTQLDQIHESLKFTVTKRPFLKEAI